MEKMARPLPLNPTFLPPTHGVLKSLLENPLKLPFHHDEGLGKDKEKEKKLDDEGTAANHPQSAFLGPTLWDKTLSYDGDNFQLEYMDLEEFLSENGIPANTAQRDQTPQAPQAAAQAPPPAPPTPTTPTVVDLSSRATTSVHTGMAPQPCLHSPTTAASRDTPQPHRPRVHPGSHHLRPRPRRPGSVQRARPGDVRPQETQILRRRAEAAADDQEGPQGVHPRGPEGRQVLGPAQKEQRGGQEVTGRPAAEGEPDRHPRRLPGEGERRTPHGGSGHEEGAGPLQEHCG
nr:hepatic leukemia factor-like isoform X1 [Labrus bergylta]